MPESAVELLYLEYSRYMKNLARKFRPYDVYAQEELCSEVWLRVTKYIGKFDGVNFRGWSAMIMRNVIINQWRKKRVETVPLDVVAYNLSIIPELYGDNEISDDVQAVLNSINPQQLRVVLQQCIEGLSVKEIAIQNKIPSGTVLSRAKRGKDALQEKRFGDAFKA